MFFGWNRYKHYSFYLGRDTWKDMQVLEEDVSLCLLSEECATATAVLGTCGSRVLDWGFTGPSSMRRVGFEDSMNPASAGPRELHVCLICRGRRFVWRHRRQDGQHSVVLELLKVSGRNSRWLDCRCVGFVSATAVASPVPVTAIVPPHVQAPYLLIFRSLTADCSVSSPTPTSCCGSVASELASTPSCSPLSCLQKED